MFVGKDDKCNTCSKAFSLHANSFMGTAETAHYCFDIFFFVLFGNMEILLLVQKWCNASSNTKNSTNNNNKSSTLSLLKIPAPSLIYLTEKPKKNHQDFTRQTASNWQILSVSHFHPSTNSSLTCWVENTQE